MLPTRFRFIWQSGFRSEEKIVQKSTNQKQELPMAAMFVNGSERNEHSLQRTFQGCFLPNFDSFGQVPKCLQKRRFFRNQPIRNKNCLWRPCLLTDCDEMSNLYRGHAIDASYQVSVHLTKQFQRKRLLRIDQPEKKNCLRQRL